ncbi:hypothetical protein N7540_012703 [Penicillium herquei]|nr:hypothetical protein N7540_012703 [Penicillium herquei]
MNFDKLPNVDDPFFYRVFMIFSVTLKQLFTTVAPVVLAVLAFFAIPFFIVLFISHFFTALGSKNTPPKSTPFPSVSDASSSDVDEKKRLEIEIEFLSELMQSRQERLKELVKSE